MEEKQLTNLNSQIIELLEEKKLMDIKGIFTELQEEDIAELFNEIDEEYMPILYRLLSKERAIEVFEDLDVDKQLSLLDNLSNERTSEIIEQIDSDVRTDLFEEAPAKVVNRLMGMLSPQKRKIASRILGYPEDSVGRLINNKFLAVNPNITVSKAIKKIRELGNEKETVFYTYVVDDTRKLLGVISLKDIILADPADKIENIAERNIVTVNPYMDQEEVVEIFEKYDLLALPVVDRENRMIGIVTFDDVSDIIEEEMEEDFEVMAGITHTDETYMSASVFHLVKKRVIWLVIFLLIETLSGVVLQHYHDFLAQFIFLSFFIPMLLNAGGTSGSQTSTLVIRGIATGEIKFKDIFKVIWKETVSTIIIALILSLVVFARVYILKDMHVNYLLLVGIISLTLLIVIWLATTIAAILPLISKKIGLDPAVLSGPFVTTTIDVLGLILYFKIAMMFLK